MHSGFSDPLAVVLGSQNRDGGWGYRGGSSWTEPTVYALMALDVGGRQDGPFQTGLAWITGHQRRDGGWPPHPSVDQSTWVTALALQVCAGRVPGEAAGRAVAWLLGQAGRESGVFQRMREWMLGVSRDTDTTHDGWPWYPGAAAWVTPTALTILALEKARRLSAHAGLDRRIETGRQFLLAHRCEDDGWNHGGARSLGQGAASYPETTGLALLALHGLPAASLKLSIDRAERHLAGGVPVEARAWLELGLLANGRKIAETSPGRCRGSVDAALSLVARAAAAGRNVLVS
jgi:hypothetical protein